MSEKTEIKTEFTKIKSEFTFQEEFTKLLLSAFDEGVLNIKAHDKDLEYPEGPALTCLMCVIFNLISVEKRINDGGLLNCIVNLFNFNLENFMESYKKANLSEEKLNFLFDGIRAARAHVNNCLDNFEAILKEKQEKLKSLDDEQ